jgi:hypothetical protein
VLRVEVERAPPTATTASAPGATAPPLNSAGSAPAAKATRTKSGSIRQKHNTDVFEAISTRH